MTPQCNVLHCLKIMQLCIRVPWLQGLESGLILEGCLLGKACIAGHERPLQLQNPVLNIISNKEHTVHITCMVADTDWQKLGTIFPGQVKCRSAHWTNHWERGQGMLVWWVGVLRSEWGFDLQILKKRRVFWVGRNSGGQSSGQGRGAGEGIAGPGPRCDCLQFQGMFP